VTYQACKKEVASETLIPIAAPTNRGPVQTSNIRAKDVVKLIKMS
jgi:hypothetical protein